MKTALITLSAVSVLAVASAFLAISQFSLSAISEPGTVETYLASTAKHIYLRRRSRERIPQAPANLGVSVEQGDKLFGTDCADCHGVDGHKPTDAGRWMYPRAADLTSLEAQQYSDRELFWIVKNGIRFSGMPAFSNVETDEHIWNLVHYLRTLGPSPNLR